MLDGWEPLNTVFCRIKSAIVPIIENVSLVEIMSDDSGTQKESPDIPLFPVSTPALLLWQG